MFDSILLFALKMVCFWLRYFNSSLWEIQNQHRKWVNNSFALMPMPAYAYSLYPKSVKCETTRRNKKQKKWNELYL